MTNCPACGEKIKEGVFGSNLLLATEKVTLINEYHSEKSAYRCAKCGDPLYAKYKDSLSQERYALAQKVQKELPAMPIVSLQSPLGWRYSVCGLVTAQSTTGTGVLSEFTSNWTDMFGLQSKAYNKKLKAGEDICKSILRKEALELGGNAVLATDIDYAEVGGDKGMLMVCMAGTAVRLENPEALGEATVRSFGVLSEVGARLNHLAKYGDTAA